MSCIFCGVEETRIVDKNQHFFAIKDNYPLTPSHILIVSIRHAETWFDLTNEEQISSISILKKQKDILRMSDTSITGFNIGINCGESAGQTIQHCHIHLIPRRVGDHDDPRGGIRLMFPDKAAYWSDEDSK